MEIFDVNGNRLMTGENHYRSFSVLSDSYSAFDGFVDPAGNAAYYPKDYIDIEKVDEMWWYLFAKSYESILQINNSYSGSTIANAENSETTSFVARMNDLGKPELIFILGGTNDSWESVTIGDYKYSDWTTEDLKSFRPAVAYMLDHLLHHNVGAKIIFLLNLFQTAEDDYFVSIKTICEHYNVDVIDLSTINKQAEHPSATGMVQIRDKIMMHFGIDQKFIRDFSGGWQFPYDAGSGLSFVELPEAFEQNKYYQFDLDGVVSSNDAYFEIRCDQNMPFVTFPAGQNGKVIVRKKAKQYDAVARASLRCVGGTGTVNSLRIREIELYDT